MVYIVCAQEIATRRACCSYSRWVGKEILRLNGIHLEPAVLPAEVDQHAGKIKYHFTSSISKSEQGQAVSSYGNQQSRSLLLSDLANWIFVCSVSSSIVFGLL